jgi:hypothetical protein
MYPHRHKFALRRSAVDAFPAILTGGVRLNAKYDEPNQPLRHVLHEPALSITVAY